MDREALALYESTMTRPRQRRLQRTPSRAPTRTTALLVAASLALVCVAGCRSASSRRSSVTPAPVAPALRIGAAAQEGDSRRRASTQLVLDGLAAEMRGNVREAATRYGDALRVDANNPLAALAFARYEIFAGDPDRGLAHLDRYAALAGPAADGAHLAGLRGAALARLGKGALAAPYLQEARTLAPAVWADAKLEARELR